MISSGKVPSAELEIRISRRSKQRQTWMLLATLIVVTVLLSAVVGLVAGLGVVRSEEDGSSVTIVTAVVS